MAYFGAGGFAALSVGRSNISTNPDLKKKTGKNVDFLSKTSPHKYLVG